MKREHIPMQEKLAATLYELERWRMRAEAAEAKIEGTTPALGFSERLGAILRLRHHNAPAVKVASLYHFHHEDFHAHGGPDGWRNLTPMFCAEHRERTKRDLATIAKGKRIQRKQAEHIQRMEAKHADGPDPRSNRATQKRSFPNRQGAARNSHRATRRG